jgi:hypothetical protein
MIGAPGELVTVILAMRVSSAPRVRAVRKSTGATESADPVRREKIEVILDMS